VLDIALPANTAFKKVIGLLALALNSLPLAELTASISFNVLCALKVFCACVSIVSLPVLNVLVSAGVLSSFNNSVFIFFLSAPKH
jgi:hypothetical protein